MGIFPIRAHVESVGGFHRQRSPSSAPGPAMGTGGAGREQNLPAAGADPGHPRSLPGAGQGLEAGSGRFQVRGAPSLGAGSWGSPGFRQFPRDTREHSLLSVPHLLLATLAVPVPGLWRAACCAKHSLSSVSPGTATFLIVDSFS